MFIENVSRETISDGGINGIVFLESLCVSDCCCVSILSRMRICVANAKNVSYKIF